MVGVMCGVHFSLQASVYFPSFLRGTCIAFVIKIKGLFSILKERDRGPLSNKYPLLFIATSPPRQAQTVLCTCPDVSPSGEAIFS